MSPRLSRPPRIVFCADTYPPQVNGVSVVTALSVSGLRARGWRCAVVAPRYPRDATSPFATGEERPDLLLALPSVPLPRYPEIRLALPPYGSVAELVRQFEPDLVHCETEFVIGCLGQIAARRAGIPIVTSYHTDFSRYVDAYHLPWLRRPAREYLGRFHRRAARTYTPGSPARRDLLALGVRDVEVWGRGVDTTSFTPVRRSDALRATLGAAERFLFLYVGRLAAEKNVEVLLDAFELARRLLPPATIRLVLAGAGPRSAELRARAGEAVTFLGNLDRRTLLPQLYASADAFLFASVTETLGVVVLEAMASGLPVLATPVGGVADHLRDGVNGFAFPANDVAALAHRMVELVMRPAQTHMLAAGALRTARTRDWSAEIERLDASYREVLARAARARSASRGPALGVRATSQESEVAVTAP